MRVHLMANILFFILLLTYTHKKLRIIDAIFLPILKGGIY